MGFNFASLLFQVAYLIKGYLKNIVEQILGN